MANWIVISVIAGLAAAALNAAIVKVSLVSALLFYMAPLPLLIAGLGAGAVSAALAGLIGGAVTLALTGLKPALLFLASAAVAPVVLSHLAMINRPAGAAGDSEGEASAGGTEWYPEGRLLLWTCLMAGVLMTLAIVIIGPDAASFRAELKSVTDEVLAPVIAQMPEDQHDQAARLGAMLNAFIPLATPVLWVAAMMGNLWIAARIVTASGRALRPWAPFSRLSFPKLAPAALAGALAASLLPGTAGLVAQVFAVSLGAGFTFIGLAVVHALTLGNPLRGFVLGLLYAVLLFFSWVVAVPLALLGIADTAFSIRGAPPRSV